MIKKLIIALAASSVIATSAWAGNWTSHDFLLVSGSAPVQTPTPSVTPTPVPSATPTPGNSATVDPNATSYTVALLHYLQSLEGAGTSHHLIESAQIQFGDTCNGLSGTNFGAGYGTNCSGAWNAQTGVNGNGLQLGAVGIDPSSINQAGNVPIASFGPSSTADIMCKYVWSQGGLCISHTDFPNPIDDWNNVNGNVSVPTTCAGQNPGTLSTGAWGTIYDCNNNSGLSWDAYVQSMLTCPQSYCMHIGTATTANQHWNTELGYYVQTWSDLQSSNIPVIVGMFQEYDGSAMWHGAGQLSIGTFSALFYYVEQYWQAQGIHNLLYMYASNSGGLAGDTPTGGCDLDMLGYDLYSSINGTPVVYPQYSNNQNVANNCGKPNMPQGIMEYGLGGDGEYNALATSNDGSPPDDPNLVFANCWSIGSCGNEPSNYSVEDSSWPALISNAYTEQITGVAAGR